MATNKAATPRKPKQRDLLGELDTSIRAATWISGSDSAAVELARVLCRQIMAGEVSPQIVGRFMDTLRDLGLTVEARKRMALGIKENKDDKLAEIRNISPAKLRVAGAPDPITGT